MNREQISALMDGEFDEARARSLCAQLKSEESVECWAAYHLIGDALRNDCLAQPGFARRFAERLAAEPTVLSPGYKALAEGGSGTGWQAAIRSRPWHYGMAAAASAAAVALVGWFGVQEFTLGPGAGEFAAARRPAPVLATAADSKATAQASRKSQNAAINPYLLVHQEYSPTTAMQGVRPYVRTVADMAASE
ncbi:MAG: sigma-E factor negative regulatory protein [Betaproteobacteria bacterium]|nr:sigma-E factor negative regulatory protein [Betaproteobacteria bacterium]